jgi:hypothetical protein
MFCHRKQADLTVNETAMRSDIGDSYRFTAQDQDSRLVAYQLLDERSAYSTRRFMVRLADRIAGPEAGKPKSSSMAGRPTRKPLTGDSARTPAWAASSSNAARLGCSPTGPKYRLC